MNKTIEAMKMEVARAKERRRNAEEELERFRSEVEQGKIRVRVSKDEAFRRELAEAVVEEAIAQKNLPWHEIPDYYADPLYGWIHIKHAQDLMICSSWRALPVKDLVAAGNYLPDADHQGSEDEARNQAIARALQNIKDEVIIDLGAKQ